MAQATTNNVTVQFSRGDVLSDKCPSRNILNHVTSRWGVLVLLALKDERQHRFSELRRKINGVSEKMLAQTLQQLESDGFVLRTAHPVVPPHVEYNLTALGVQVAHRVVGLVDWLEENILHILQAQAAYNQEKNPDH